MSGDLGPGYEERQAARIRAYDQAMAEARENNQAHLEQAAIDNCELCDREGYRRPELTIVCDHIDRTTIAARGAAACRAALSKLPKS